MKLISRIKCLLGKHNWRYYHRKVRAPNPGQLGYESTTFYETIRRRVCIHCGKRETAGVDFYDKVEENAAMQRLGARALNAAKREGLLSSYVPPEGVSNESGLPPQESWWVSSWARF